MFKQNWVTSKVKPTNNLKQLRLIYVSDNTNQLRIKLNAKTMVSEQGRQIGQIKREIGLEETFVSRQISLRSTFGCYVCLWRRWKLANREATLLYTGWRASRLCFTDHRILSPMCVAREPSKEENTSSSKFLLLF